MPASTSSSISAGASSMSTSSTSTGTSDATYLIDLFDLDIEPDWYETAKKKNMQYQVELEEIMRLPSVEAAEKLREWDPHGYKRRPLPKLEEFFDLDS